MDLTSGERRERKRSLKLLKQQQAELETIEDTKKNLSYSIAFIQVVVVVNTTTAQSGLSGIKANCKGDFTIENDK